MRVIPKSFTPKALPEDLKFLNQTWAFSAHEGPDQVNCEVQRWTDWEGKGKWNYYLYVPLDKLAEPEKWAPKYDASKPSWSQFDYDNSLFNEIGFHGGVTYCRINIHGTNQVIKVGCDYAHIFDSVDMDSEHESVFADAAETARRFLEAKPYIKAV